MDLRLSTVAAALAALLVPGPPGSAQAPRPPSPGPLAVSVHFVSGLASVEGELRDAMVAQGFDDTFVPALSGAPTDHPRTDGAGFAWIVSATYAVRAPVTVGAAWAGETTLGSANGYRAPGLFVGAAAHASVLAATVGLDLGGVRVAAGPARYQVRWEVTGTGAEEESTSAFGGLVEAAAGIPFAGERLRSELLVQYRLVGGLDVGPATVEGRLGAEPATFRATPVTLRHLVFGLGLRLVP